MFSCTSKAKLNSKMNEDVYIPNKAVKKKQEAAVKIEIVEQKETETQSENRFDFSNNTDSFLKEIKQQNETIVSLTQVKKEKTLYAENEIWSAQISSSTSKDFAENLRNEIQKKYALPVYIVQEFENYKVLVGKKKSRADLDQLLGELKHYGYDSAWAVNHSISEAVENEKNKEDTLYPYFSLQVGTYSSEISAEKTKKALSVKTDLNVYILIENNLYKVLVEKEKNRMKLAEAKEKLEKLGYKTWFRDFK
jgi:cell division protein FtsN